MSLNDDDRELLIRCAASARAGAQINPGMLSRFYKALANCHALTPKDNEGEDLAAALDALSVAGRPPIDGSRRAGGVLLELAKRATTRDVRDAAVDALLAYWRRHPPRDPSTPRDLYTSSTFTTARRFRLALVAGEKEDIEHATGLVPKVTLHLDTLKELQERLLEGEAPSPAKLELVEALYTSGSSMCRRVLLQQLGEGHEAFVPTLARIASQTDPSTRRASVAALRRIAHVSVESILLALLDEVERSVRSDIVDALGDLGTRACLARLMKLREDDRALAKPIDATFARIEARYPVSAREGSLSMAEEGPAGALSLAGASPGDVALYQSVEDALSGHGPEPEQALTRAPQTELTTSASWSSLVTGPRRIPFAYTARELGVGRRGYTFIAWIILSGGLLLAHVTLGIMFFAGMYFLLFALPGSWVYLRRHRVLRDGSSTFAQLTDYSTTPGYRSGPSHHYTFSYMDEHEQTHEATVVFKKRMVHLEDDALEPILFTPDNTIMLFDEVPHLVVSEDGQLASANPLNVLGALGPLMALAATLYSIHMSFA